MVLFSRSAFVIFFLTIYICKGEYSDSDVHEHTKKEKSSHEHVSHTTSTGYSGRSLSRTHSVLDEAHSQHAATQATQSGTLIVYK